MIPIGTVLPVIIGVPFDLPRRKMPNVRSGPFDPRAGTTLRAAPYGPTSEADGRSRMTELAGKPSAAETRSFQP